MIQTQPREDNQPRLAGNSEAVQKRAVPRDPLDFLIARRRRNQVFFIERRGGTIASPAYILSSFYWNFIQKPELSLGGKGKRETPDTNVNHAL